MEPTKAEWCNGRMNVCRGLLPVVIVALLLPVAAHAGAPNYDCTLEKGRGRLAIDQWRPKVVVTGLGSRSTVGGAVGDIAQNGPSLDFTTTISGIRWKVAIRRYKAVTMTNPGATFTGRCLFIPGNFILRSADQGGHVLRAAPAAGSSALLSVTVGAPVWESPNASPKGRWLPVLAVKQEGHALASVSGWLRQAGPYQGRAN
jgi:hypothetical protein